MRQACEIEGWRAAFTPLQRAKAGDLWIIPETLKTRMVKRRERRAPANPKGIVTSSPRLAR